MDRERAKEARTSIESALHPIGEILGLHFELGPIKFGPHGLRATLKAHDDDGEPATHLGFKLHAQKWGLIDQDLGRRFLCAEREYELIGAKPANRRFPILGRCVKTGKIYKFPPYAVKAGFDRTF